MQNIRKVYRDYIVMQNGQRGYNAPLFYKETYGYLLTGEYPCVKMIANVALYGSCVFFSDTQKKTPFQAYKAKFYPNKTVYTVQNDGYLKITVLPSAQGAGVCMKITGTCKKVGIAWGGMHATQNGSFAVRVAYDPGRNSTALYDEAEQVNTDVRQINDTHILLQDCAENRTATYQFEGATDMKTVRAKNGVTYTTLSVAGGEIYVYGVADGEDMQSAKEAFRLAKERNAREASCFRVKTPDPRLDLITAFATTASNATFVDNVYNHGCCAWSIPYLGWENIIGGVVLNKQANIERELRLTHEKVVRVKELKNPVPSVERKYTMQADESRIFGYGYVDIHQGRCYNMQSQYYDQLIYATQKFDSPVLDNLLKEDLPLHSVWQDECFDPQGSGLYESYINTWPTDSVWCNGGKGVEETAFAYAVKRYLAQTTGERKYAEQARKIKRAFKNTLWVKDKGYPAFYKDVIGEKLLHEQPWSYSIYYAVNTELTDAFEKVQALYFMEYGLETVERNEGKSTYTSNFVPYVWSVRDLDLQCDYQTAEGYFRAGLYDTGFDVFRNAYVQCFAGKVPCSLTGNSRTTNFASTVALYLRATSDGLFGVTYSDKGKRVRIRPAFPRSWKKAEYVSEKLSYTYRRTKEKITVKINGACEEVKLVLPTYFQKIERVKGGSYTHQKGMLYPLVCVKTKGNATVEIFLSGEPRYNKERYIELVQGMKKRIRGLIDPQGVFERSQAVKGGHHTVFADRGTHYEVYRIHVKTEKKAGNQRIEGIRESLPIHTLYNGDVTKVYQQEYLSPRVKTCSAQLGIDGFSSWTGVLWKTKPPAVSLDGFDGNEVLGEKFEIQKRGNNAVMISQYDNYPTRVKIPVRKQTKGICVLFAGTTNPMQCNVPAMRITVEYIDGEKAETDVVPPYNFWGIADCIGTGQADHESYYGDPKHQYPLQNSVAKTQVIGENCRVNVLYIPAMAKRIERIEFRAMANETVMGIIGVSLIK